MFLQSSPLLSSVVRMEFGREVFHDGLEPLDASRLAQGEKVRCATPAFHNLERNLKKEEETLSSKPTVRRIYPREMTLMSYQHLQPKPELLTYLRNPVLRKFVKKLRCSVSPC